MQPLSFSLVDNGDTDKWDPVFLRAATAVARSVRNGKELSLLGRECRGHAGRGPDAVPVCSPSLRTKELFSRAGGVCVCRCSSTRLPSHFSLDHKVRMIRAFSWNERIFA